MPWHGKAPDSKVHGANMGPIWGRQDPGGPHVGPLNLATWGFLHYWTFARGIHQLSLDSPWSVMGTFYVFFVIALNKLLNKQSNILTTDTS